jgi:hypothetical protein
MPDVKYGYEKRPVTIETRKPRRLKPPRRRQAERRYPRERPPRIPEGKGEYGPQDKPTSPTELTGPGEGHEITFESYTPLLDPKNPGIFNLAPPDPSGDDSGNGVVLYVGNTYLVGSTDGGATFADHDPTAFLPAGVGHPVDQVMLYVPHRDLYCWMLQYNPSASGDGNFRLAVAHGQQLHADVESGWTCYDFTSSDLGSKGVATDRQDLAYSESRLYMTTNLVGKGRVVMSLSLDDLANATSVTWGYTNPLDKRYKFSDLSQQNPQNVHMVAIKSDTELEVMTYDDGAGTYGFNTVKVGKFPNASDLSSLDPDGVDWLTRGVANVSASVVDGRTLWTAWDASASAPNESPSYPNAHVRIARIDLSSWTAIDERQVWNPDYAFAYGCLAVLNGDIGYGVAVGGKNDYPNSCFGILGDYVVYYRDTSTATGGLPTEARWGDYITVRPSHSRDRRFAAFGYYTDGTGASYNQRPFHLSYGRP